MIADPRYVGALAVRGRQPGQTDCSAGQPAGQLGRRQPNTWSNQVNHAIKQRVSSYSGGAVRLNPV
jgi:hypothetical protein